MSALGIQIIGISLLIILVTTAAITIMSRNVDLTRHFQKIAGVMAFVVFLTSIIFKIINIG